jgi:hypothetical protein
VIPSYPLIIKRAVRRRARPITRAALSSHPPSRLLSLAMAALPSSPPGLTRTIICWSREHARSYGMLPMLRNLAGKLWEFARESTPARRRARYGDIDYDWDHRVDTTSATVSGADRLRGLFHSPYQPTEPGLFREMVLSLRFDFSQSAFIDLGSGKGRTLLMASHFPFRRILGVELLPALHRIAKNNILSYQSDSQKCRVLETVCEDATRFVFPNEEMVLYLFNPLPEAGFVQVISNLEQSLAQHWRPVHVLYHNPLLERVLAESKSFKKVSGTHQYSLYRNLS